MEAINIQSTDNRAISLTEAAQRLGVAGLGDRIVGARLRIWRDVVIERWLTSSDARADIMGALTDPAVLDEHERPAWSRTPVVSEWLCREDPLQSSVLWFEWDRPRDAEAAALARPLVSICVADVVLAATAERRVPVEPAGRARLIDRSLALFEQQRARPRLNALLDRLEAHAQLTHIAGLRPRERDGVRLVIWMRADEVEAWLRACAWPGPLDAVAPLVAASAAPYRKLGVQLELRDGELGPYLGLETPEYSYRPTPVQFRSWVELLRRFGAAIDDGTLAELSGMLRPGPQADWRGPDRLYLKAAYDGRWHAKAYMAAGPTVIG
jgi:hypothetical protein